MKIANLITLDRVSCDNNAKSKKKVLEALSSLLVSASADLSAEEIFESLINRERLGSTGLGHGVALPHARLPGREKAVGAFIKLDQPVDFDAIDNQPTDLLFCLLVPDHFTDEHLEILSQLATIFSDKAFCEELRKSSTEEQLLQLLTQHPTSSVA